MSIARGIAIGCLRSLLAIIGFDRGFCSPRSCPGGGERLLRGVFLGRVFLERQSHFRKAMEKVRWLIY